MSLDLDFLVDEICGTTFLRPLGSGAISGHAAGEPFDKHVESCIREKYPAKTFRQFELLNAVLAANPSASGYEERCGLFGPPALRKLICRGKDAMRGWSLDNQFEEKQNDTADIIVLPDADLDLHVPTIHLVDVKSHSLDRSGQPPNIISALKLARMSAEMIHTGEFDSHDITYVGIEWDLSEDADLVARDCSVRELFKAPPEQLYINWAAALQIQFQVRTLDQSFDAPTEEWCQRYLRHFTGKAKERQVSFRRDFIDAFTDYLT